MFCITVLSDMLQMPLLKHITVLFIPSHWFMLLYKTLLGLSPPYLCHTISAAYKICAAHLILLKVLKTNTMVGLSSFQATAAKDCNNLQKTLKLDNLSPCQLSRTLLWTWYMLQFCSLTNISKCLLLFLIYSVFSPSYCLYMLHLSWMLHCLMLLFVSHMFVC